MGSWRKHTCTQTDSNVNNCSVIKPTPWSGDLCRTISPRQYRKLKAAYTNLILMLKNCSVRESTHGIGVALCMTISPRQYGKLEEAYANLILMLKNCSVRESIHGRGVACAWLSLQDNMGNWRKPSGTNSSSNLSSGPICLLFLCTTEGWICENLLETIRLVLYHDRVL